MDEILEYENLVYSVVAKFKNNYDIEDLKQVGMMGLAKAYQNYKSDQGTKFSTYAYTYILGEVLTYIRNSRALKVNRETQALYQKILQVKEVMMQKLMREPTTFEIACFLELEEQLIIEAIEANQFVKSLDYSLNEEDDNKNIAMYDLVQYEERGYDADILDLKIEIDKLSEEEKLIIYDRYFNDLTQKEVSEKLNTSQVQISRNETKILKKLKDRLAA